MAHDWMDEMDSAARDVIRAQETRQIAERQHGSYSSQHKKAAQAEWDTRFETFGSCFSDRPEMDEKMAMDEKDLIDGLVERNGKTVYAPESVAIGFLDSCRKRGVPVKCTMEFSGGGAVKIIMPNASGEGREVC